MFLNTISNIILQFILKNALLPFLVKDVHNYLTIYIINLFSLNFGYNFVHSKIGKIMKFSFNHSSLLF